jgi:hypothetical protein
MAQPRRRHRQHPRQRRPHAGGAALARDLGRVAGAAARRCSGRRSRVPNDGLERVGPGAARGRAQLVSRRWSRRTSYGIRTGRTLCAAARTWPPCARRWGTRRSRPPDATCTPGPRNPAAIISPSDHNRRRSSAPVGVTSPDESSVASVMRSTCKYGLRKRAHSMARSRDDADSGGTSLP